MSLPSPAELLAFLQEHGFLTPDQSVELSTGGVKFPDGRALARTLLERDWLTPYQVNQLLQGRGAGLLLGPYRLLDRLGEGGMGQVFKARHVGMDRIVALKIIPKDKVSNPAAVSRFYREVRAVAKLSHPNIVIAFDVSQSGDTHFLAMELVQGIDLHRLVQQSGPLTIPKACDFIRQAALGLQHAHEKGLVHRDIKPANLIVARPHPDQPPVIKILDFGLARLDSEEGQGTRLTQIGNIVGTVDFMAPEQAENARTAGIRADIYSLGCALFFLLTGKVPFPGDNAMQKLSARLIGECPSVRAIRPEVPSALERVIAKMMARNSADRYATPDEVAKALEPHAREAPPAGSATKAASAGAFTAKPSAPAKNEAIEAPRRRKSALRPAPVAAVSDDVPIARKSSKLPYVAAACLLGLIALGAIIALRSRDGTIEDSVPVAQGPKNVEAPVENPFAPTVVEAPKGETKAKPAVDVPKKEIEPAPKVEPAKKESPVKPVDDTPPKVNVKPETKPAVEPGKKEPPVKRVDDTPKADPKPEVKPEVKPQTKPAAKIEAKPDARFIPTWQTIKCPSFCSIAITPDGRTAVTAGPGIDVWDLATGTHVRNLAPATTKISGSVAISPDGKQVAGIGGNQTLRIWDLDSGKALRSYDYPAERRLSGVAWSNTGDYIAVGSGPFVDIFEAAALTSKPSVSNKSELGEVQTLAFYRDGVTIIYGMENGQIRSVPVVGGKIFDAFRHVPATKVNQLVSSNNLVLSVGLDKTFRVWETYPLLRELKRHDLKANARAVAASPSGLYAVTGGDDRMLHFWSLSTQTILQSYQAGGAVRGVAFAANGRFFLSTSDDGKLRAWKVPEEAVRDWRDDLAGTWKLKYTNGVVRTYKIDDDGGVYFFEDKIKGRLERIGDHLILTFVQDARLERIYPSRQGTLLIDHYAPSTSYPRGKPAQYAEAVRIDDAAPPSAARPSWDHVHLGQAKVMDGFVRIPKGKHDLTTKEWYAGGIDIHVTARTEKNNIRLYAFNGACVIFNWEDNHSELRITRPDGIDKAESGTLTTARVLPLTPNVSYPLRWRITEQGMSVWVKDELVYNEKRQYNLAAKRPVKIHAHDSDIDVSHFEVTPIK